MATYVDGYVIAIPKKNFAAYRKMATMAEKIWRKHGALNYKECVIDDAKPKGVTLTFAKLAKTKPREAVWFSYIEYKSRKHRDQVNAKVMKEMDKLMEDPKYKNMPMPFEMKRMAYAGFTAIVG